MKTFIKFLFVLPFIPFLFLEHALRWIVGKEKKQDYWSEYHVAALVRYLFNKVFGNNF